MMRTIGAISDTHGLLRPQAVAALAGCNPIIHAGDVGSPDVLARLGALHPSTLCAEMSIKAPGARTYL
jgi:predicted phosphodiesterase